MELRPCAPGERYEGPVRIPVRRSSGAQAINGVTYRPLRKFWHLRTAGYNDDLKHFQQMAEERRVKRKAEEEKIRIFGPDISIEDPNTGPLDATCKVLKQTEHDGHVRLYYRRQVTVIIYDS